MRKFITVAVLMACMGLSGCQYSGTGVMVIGPPQASLKMSWNGTVGANPVILGFTVPTVFKFGLGADGVKDVMGPAAPDGG